MSILIKGMDMPISCWGCEIFSSCPTGSLNECLKYVESRNPNCPLVEIPTPHGRLVEEHYPGELKAKQAEGIYILFRSADEDTDRFILEEER